MDQLMDTWTEIRARLFGFVVRRVHDEAVAHDIVSEVFLRVHKSSDSLRFKGALVSWIFRVAANLIADHHRFQGRFQELSDEIAQLEMDTDSRGELVECIRPLLAQLPLEYRQAVEWSELEGVVYREIAERTGVGISGIKSRVQRGRAMLLQRLQACCSLDSDGSRNGQGGGCGSASCGETAPLPTNVLTMS